MNPQLPPSTGSYSAPATRNGLLRACEPCRRRKVACDHSFPVCERCMATRAPEACVYIPEKRRDRLPRTHRQPTRPSAAGRSVPGTAAARDWDGFLGPSSTVSILDEANSLLDAGNPGTRRSDARLASHDVDIGAGVLACIPEAGMCRALLEANSSPIDSWVSVVAIQMSDSMWSVFGLYLKEPRPEHSLHDMAQYLCDATQFPLDENHHELGETWVASFSGWNIRWEAMGILFALWAVGAAQASDLPSNDTKKATPKLSSLLDCVQACLGLSKNGTTTNTLMLYLLIKYVHLSSLVHGEGSLATQSAIAEAVAVAISLGVHLEACPSNTSTFFMTQIKCRLFAHLFILDKNMALFTGRPPLLSGRYCSSALPLDLTDEDLLHGSRDPSVLLGLLDENGWNKTTSLRTVTVLRARTMIAYIRDKVLELLLGFDHHTTVEYLLNLYQQEIDTRDALPAFLIYYASNQADRMPEAQIVFARILIYLEHLQNLFFIKRLLVKTRADETDAIDLIETSHEMLQVAQDLQVHFSHLKGLKYSYAWLVTGYVCPPAGALCAELLTPSSVLHTTQLHARKLQIIWQLRLLEGFLRSITAETSTMALCMRVKELIRRVVEPYADVRWMDLLLESQAGAGWGDAVMKDRYQDGLLSLEDLGSFE